MMADLIKSMRGAVFLAFLLTGCASILPREAIEQQAFSWVDPGRTTRSDVIFALGMPRSVFEQDTIFVYGVSCPSAAECRTVPWRGLVGGDVRYQLVLIFDATGLLERRELLRELYVPEPMIPSPNADP